MKGIFPVLLLLIFGAEASEIFHEEYVQYRDANFLLLQPGQELDFRPSQFCRTLKTNNPELGKIKCREAAEFRRNPAFQRYTSWLEKNIFPESSPELLASRITEVDVLLKDARDDYLLVFFSENRQVLLFHGGKTKPAAFYEYSKKNSLFRKIARDLFAQQAVRIPTEKERETARTSPTAYYRDGLALDRFVGYGYGELSGKFPGVPESWYSSDFNARVRSYNRVPGDSLSAWNWVEHRSNLQTLRAGIRYARFLGVAALVKYSTYDVKTDLSDSLYDGLSTWSFDRYELGLHADMGLNWQPLENLEFYPHLLLGFLYAFYVERFSLSDSSPGIDVAPNRFDFPTVKGANIGLGILTLFDNRYGLQVEAGISGRGASKDVDALNADTTPPQIIGGVTTDFYALVSLIYNWRTWIE